MAHANARPKVLLAREISSHEDFVGLVAHDAFNADLNEELAYFARSGAPTPFYALIVDRENRDIRYVAGGRVVRIERGISGYELYLKAEAAFPGPDADDARLLNRYRYSIAPTLVRASRLIVRADSRLGYLVSFSDFSVLASGQIFFASTILHFLRNSMPADLFEFPSSLSIQERPRQDAWFEALTMALDRLDEELVAPTALASESLTLWSALRQQNVVPHQAPDDIVFAPESEGDDTNVVRLVPGEVGALKEALGIQMVEGKPVSGLLAEIRAEMSSAREDEVQRRLARRFPYPGPWRI